MSDTKRPDDHLRLSWSRHSTSEECDLRYWLKYHKKARRPPKHPHSLIVGKAVHTAVEYWSKGAYKGDLSKIALACFDKATAGKPLTDHGQHRTKVAGAGFYTEQIYRQLGVPEHGIIEYPVEHDLLEKLSLYGIIDLYMPNTGTVFDLKVTGATSSYKPDPGQLMMYALILSKKNQPVREIGFIYPLRPKTPIVRHPIEDGVLEEFESLMMKSSDKIKSHKPDVRPKGNRAHHCNWCEYSATEFCPTSDILDVFKGRVRTTKGSKRRKAPRKKLTKK